MKVISIIFFISLLSCTAKEKPNLSGIWERDGKPFIILDSVMAHPSYYTYELIKYSIENDSLKLSAVDNLNIIPVNYSIEYFDGDSLVLLDSEDDLKFSKIKTANSSISFEEIKFSNGPSHGRRKIFSFELDQLGNIEYIGNARTKFIGKHSGRLNESYLKLINDAISLLDFQEYPYDELQPPIGNAKRKLHIKFKNGATFEIIDGNFEGNYFDIIPHVFYDIDNYIILTEEPTKEDK